MARIRGPVYNIDNNKKKTDQGNGTYSRKPHAGGETFHNDVVKNLIEVKDDERL